MCHFIVFLPTETDKFEPQIALALEDKEEFAGEAAMNTSYQGIGDGQEMEKRGKHVEDAGDQEDAMMESDEMAQPEETQALEGHRSFGGLQDYDIITSPHEDDHEAEKRLRESRVYEDKELTGAQQRGPHDFDTEARKANDYPYEDYAKLMAERYGEGDREEMEEEEEDAAASPYLHTSASNGREDTYVKEPDALQLQDGLGSGDAGCSEDERLSALQQGAVPKRRVEPDPNEQRTLTETSQPDVIPKLEISGIPSDMSEDIVTCFLESKKRSGGGEIEHFEFDSDMGTAIVSYADMAGKYL